MNRILHAPKVLPAVLLMAFASVPALCLQHTTPLQPQATTPHRTRLILKDGSYQIIMSYKIVGNVVRYISAERGGAEEEIPLALVDLEATKRWEQQHAKPSNDPDSPAPPPIDPELLKEEAERAALTPEVAKDLRLPELDNVLALDTFHDQPQLVPIPQSEGELNHNTAHNVVKAAVNPLSSAHQLVQLKGDRSAIQLHVD